MALCITHSANFMLIANLKSSDYKLFEVRT